MVLVWLWLLGELEWTKAALLIALTAASEIFISHFGYGWRSLYFHTFLGGSPADVPRFTGADYVHALASGVTNALHSSLPVYAILWMLCLSHVRSPGWRRILSVVGLFSLARFVIFPNYEPRYYGPFFIVTAAAAVGLIADGSEGQKLGQALNSG